MLAYHVIRMVNFCLTGASATLGQGKVCWRPSRHKAKLMTVKRHTEVDGNIENMLEHYHKLLSYIELCISVAWCVLNHFDPSTMTGHILIILDTIFNRLKFPFIAPRVFFLPGQPAKFLLVPSSFRAFLASSSLLAEDLTWHVACLVCAHPTHEFPAFEHLLLPMPAIPLNSWGLRFWMAWVQMAFRSCYHSNRHLFQHTLRHWKASRLKCLDAGRVDENWWNMNPYQASKRHGRFDEEIQTVGHWELSFVNQTHRESQECLKPQSTVYKSHLHLHKQMSFYAAFNTRLGAGIWVLMAHPGSPVWPAQPHGHHGFHSNAAFQRRLFGVMSTLNRRAFIIVTLQCRHYVVTL